MFPSNLVRVLVATKPIDFRKGHDGLAALVSSVLRQDPFTGTVFVFRSRRADRLKLLHWDGTGLVMAYKRLEDSTFTWPAIKDGVMMLNHELMRWMPPPDGIECAKVVLLEPRRGRHPPHQFSQFFAA
ncbi:IS66 family insertion sequence element accessory protein TnpB [Gemmobacter sp. JM10B15]|uniref:IS66 family insertion sequence element accessory protein TnpB n=2 Tax=Gemmobacter denitrificans TaxID=3123040 RepID=A0ABU8BVM7_9RHOB